ncbi:hypothetical protein [Actinomadura sp. KC345]|uniref:hypothetical protein n=1 Tax=Actinomadura sp. KC345 TaxID=2530371 RepID=UPI0014048AE1|nr:hypothetical protein [Actinomadura sp. KC345]
MNDKPDKAEEKTTEDAGPEREKRPPRGEDTAAKGQQKKKPGDAARKMRAMFKG